MAKRDSMLLLTRTATLVLCVLLAVAIAATYAAFTYDGFLNDLWQLETSKVVTGDANADTEYYKSDYESQDELYEAKVALIREIVEEGAVLLKNENDALPLDVKTESKVSVFGRNSVSMVQGIGGGASQITPGRSDEIPDVFGSVGLEVNPTLYNFYKGKTGYSSSWSGASITIGEVPVAEYTSEAKESYAQYDDAAFVVLSRSKSEGNDLTLDPASVTDGDGVHYALQLQNNERDMIEQAKSCSDKVIVLVNSDYAMEIDELKHDDEIDAILWIGGTGYNGIYGVADIIVGNVSPSGAMADTYAASVASSPAAQNFGNYEYTNVTTDIQSNYIVYQEGIYIGYKYYETRYEDAVLGRYNASSAAGAYANADKWVYEDEVSYSFGYGLSYTTFDEEITAIDIDFANRKGTVTVNVTNTGEVAAKHVVQVYAQSPYTQYDIDNKVEKAAVQLLGYGKTEELKGGASEELTIELDLNYLASYDYTTAKTYIMEQGNYFFAIGNGAHDALNNILAAKGMTTEDGMDYDGDADKAKIVSFTGDDEVYSVSAYAEDYEITNRLESADLNYYGDMITYLSRSDWEATWPESQDSLTATDEMLADLADGASYTATEATEEDKAQMVYGSEETAYQIIMMRGESFDSKYWDSILDQLTLYEISRLVGGVTLTTIDSVTFEGGVLRDGPAGTKANYTEGKYKNESAVMFQSEVVLASTFNTEMAAAEGRMMGNDSLFLNTNAMYAPGCNIHRTPMSGRNAEYYSEDSVLASFMARSQVAGAYEYGLIMGSKHFAFNDQETHRNGLSTFLNEQAAHEIYLRAFEGSLTIGLGMMSAYNRVGCTYSSAHVGLMTNILRGEWGFKGYAISDAVGSRTLAKFADGPASVTAGLTMFCTNVENTYCGSSGSLNETAITSDPVLFDAMRQACKYNLYAFANSNAMNGYISGMEIVTVMPFYQTLVIVADIVCGVLLAGSVAAYLFLLQKYRKEDVLSE